MSEWQGEGHPGWLSQEDAELVRALVPIPCVDILPVREKDLGLEVGLITRTDYQGGETFAMVGGRVLRGETLNEAVTRHLEETLGRNISWAGSFDELAPDGLLQYFPEAREGNFGVDPTKHSIALTWMVEIFGEVVVVGGEATDFHWFDVEKLPPRKAIGFGHWRMVEKLLARRLDEE